MNLRSKFLTGLILGAASGTAITLFAKSRKGKELGSRVEKMASDIKEAGTEVIQQEIDALYSKSKQLKNKAKALTQEMTSFSSSQSEDKSSSN